GQVWYPRMYSATRGSASFVASHTVTACWITSLRFRRSRLRTRSSERSVFAGTLTVIFAERFISKSYHCITDKPQLLANGTIVDPDIVNIPDELTSVGRNARGFGLHGPFLI